MLYRIAIYKIVDGKRVFDYYASDNELNYLRVNSAGKVEQYLPNFSRVLSNFNLAPDVAWVDVSDTHVVEWGFAFDDKDMYVGDVADIQIVGKREITIGELTYYISGWEAGLNCSFTIIGNIHEEESK